MYLKFSEGMTAHPDRDDPADGVLVSETHSGRSHTSSSAGGKGNSYESNWSEEPLMGADGAPGGPARADLPSCEAKAVISSCQSDWLIKMVVNVKLCTKWGRHSSLYIITMVSDLLPSIKKKKIIVVL